MLPDKMYSIGWNVAWRFRNGNTLFPTDDHFQIIKNPKKKWVADPFLFEYDGTTYIFGEIFDLDKGKGSIGFCMPEIDQTWKTVIDEPYHMSYPYVFEFDGRIYMIPETSQNHTLQMYRAIEFPGIWEKCQVLRDRVDYVDVTLLSEVNPEKALGYIVHPDTSKSEYWLVDLKHPDLDQKIILPNQEKRRPGGKIIENESIRVAQDCTNDYGQGIIFYRFSFDEAGIYHEYEIKSIYPKDIKVLNSIYMNGIHTYNRSEHFECIDIKTRKFYFSELIGKIKRKIVRM